jgi:hypothetical protein
MLTLLFIIIALPPLSRFIFRKAFNPRDDAAQAIKRLTLFNALIRSPCFIM